MKRGKQVTVVEPRCFSCHREQMINYRKDEAVKQRNKLHMQSEERKEWRKQYRKRDHVVIQETEYKKSEAGKASQKRRKGKYYGSDKWRVQQDNQNERRRRTYSESELVRINVALSTIVGKMVHGLRQTSMSLYSYTEFADDSALLDHLTEYMKEGVTLDNYSSVWHIEHRVAKCWYSNTEEDIWLCWSKANIRPEFGYDNLQKHIKIIDSVCIETGSDFWPLSWNGVIPDEACKRDMYRAVCNRA
jgi:hypothetical protein